MRDNKWLRLLAYVTGLVNQELLLQNEYLTAESRILRAHLPPRLRLSNPERSTLAEIGKRLGRRALAEVARVAKPATILAWYRRLIASKFDGSKHRRYPGRPRIGQDLETLIVKMARENSGWGYDRIVGALANMGHHVSDQTVGNVMRRHGIEPAPRRSQNTTWREFIESSMRIPGQDEQDSGVIAKAFRGEDEHDSGLKANSDSGGKANGFSPDPGMAFAIVRNDFHR